MKGCPKSLGRGLYIDAKRRYGRRKRFETSPQFRSGFSFSEPQIGRQHEHCLVECGTTERKAEIGHGDTLEGVSLSGRSTRRFLKSHRDLLETLDCNGRNNRIPVFEMRIEDWLAIFNLFGQAANRYGIPSVALGDYTRRRDNARLALSPLPAFTLGDTQPSISLTRMADMSCDDTEA